MGKPELCSDEQMIILKQYKPNVTVTSQNADIEDDPNVNISVSFAELGGVAVTKVQNINNGEIKTYPFQWSYTFTSCNPSILRFEVYFNDGQTDTFSYSDYSCSIPKVPTIRVANTDICGKDKYVLKLNVEGGTSGEVNLAANWSCKCNSNKEDGQDTQNGQGNTTFEITMRTISGCNTVVVCSWQAKVSNYMFAQTSSGIVYLNKDNCDDPDTIDNVRDIKFVNPTKRDPLCTSNINFTEAILKREGVAYLSWITQTLGTTTSVFQLTGLFKESRIEYSSNNVYMVNSPSTGGDNQPLSVTQSIGERTQTTSTTLSVCLKSFSEPQPSITSGALVEGTCFYPYSVSSSVKVNGNFDTECESKNLSKYQLQIGDKVFSGSVAEFKPGTSSFSVTARTAYCGAGLIDTTTLSQTKTVLFENCLSVLHLGTDSSTSLTISLGSTSSFPNSKFIVPVNNLQPKDPLCKKEITYRLKAGNQKQELDGDKFIFNNLHDTLKDGTNIFDIFFQLPSGPELSEKISVSVCKFSSATLFNPSISYSAERVTLSWSLSGGNECGSDCKYEVSYSVDKTNYRPIYCYNPSYSFDLQNVSSNSVKISFSVKRVCIVSEDEIPSGDCKHEDFVCIPKKPEVKDFKCDNCINDLAFTNPTIFSFKISDKGNFCGTSNPTPVILTFMDTTVRESIFNNEYTIHVALSSESVTTLVNGNLKLIVNGYNINVNPFKFCAVESIVEPPRILSESYIVSKTSDVSGTIKFSVVPGLYSACLSSASYSSHQGLYVLYRLDSDDNKYVIKKLSAEQGDAMSLVSTYGKTRAESQQVRSIDFSLTDIPPGIHYLQVVAKNALNDELKSPKIVLKICSDPNNSNLVAPNLVAPEDGKPDVDVTDERFKFHLASPFAALKCSSSEAVYLILEMETEDEYNEHNHELSTSIGSYGIMSKFIRLGANILKLNTKYYWRISVLYVSDTGDMKSYSTEKPFSFTTVKKHCAYMNCHNGICENAKCLCYSGYRGVYCDKSGLSAGAIAGIACGISVVLLVVLVIAFILLRRKYFVGLRIPDLSQFKFSMPKRVNEDGDQAKDIATVLEIIKNDPSNNYQQAISLLESTPVTERDSVCRALMYCFERNNGSLLFLLRLIEYEVIVSDSTTTLFRNNSFASKCFKVYGRMIGLPYLFRVIFPLVNKIFKEDQKSRIEVRGDVRLTTNSQQFEASGTYELNAEMMDEDNDPAYDAALEENALLIQIACESFFNSLLSTTKYCPDEFKTVCKSIQFNVSNKYPDYPIELSLASFIFLRFFVAGITVPESFGIISKRPGPMMRRRLILIAKVISNMSTQVKFGDKEDYMTIMNEYIGSKQNELREYYGFLCNGVIKPIEQIPVPEKYFDASVSVLSYAFQKKESGEWFIDDEGNANYQGYYYY